MPYDYEPQGYYKGNFRRFKPQRQSTPVWEKSFLFAVNSAYPAVLKCWVYPPTLEHPRVGVHFQMSCGGSSAYCRVKLEDIQQLSQTLLYWSQELQETLPKLSVQESQIIMQRDLMERANMDSNPENNEQSFMQFAQMLLALQKQQPITPTISPNVSNPTEGQK